MAYFPVVTVSGKMCLMFPGSWPSDKRSSLASTEHENDLDRMAIPDAITFFISALELSGLSSDHLLHCSMWLFG